MAVKESCSELQPVLCVCCSAWTRVVLHPSLPTLGREALKAALGDKTADGM